MILNRKSFIFVLFVLFIVMLLTISSIFIPTSKIAQSEFGHLISIAFNMNRINIKTKDKDIKNKIIIKWNDDIIFNQKLVRNNIYKNRIKYGENKFTVIYDNDIILEKFQYKTNDWHYHDYIFEFKNIDNQVKCKFKIVGPNSRFFDEGD